MELSTLTKRLGGVNIPAHFVGSSGRRDLEWALDRLDDVPEAVAVDLFTQYVTKRSKVDDHYSLAGNKALVAANKWLRERAELLAKSIRSFPVDLHSLRHEECRAEVARDQANKSAMLLNETTQFGDVKVDPMDAFHAVAVIADAWGFTPPIPASFADHEALEIWVAGQLARFLDWEWWQRKINRSWDRYTEHVAILLGKTRKGASAYLSYANLQIHRQRKTAAALWMRDMLVVNEQHGLELSLLEAVNSSVANPEIRRHELMCRMRGFEDAAIEEGHVGLFITWTAPSRFHSWKQTRAGKKTVENDRFDTRLTPRDAQRHLCKQWAKCRAALAREGLPIYGFRVCEPHHDGTPHWHMLIFVRPTDWPQVVSLLQHYALGDEVEELVRKHDKNGKFCPLYTDITPRFDWKFIDPEKGSATGYIAKYIAKNLDGHKVGLDDETGLPAETTATAVTGWASWWGIRQFQQIGGPSVGTWRELRRVKEVLGPVRDIGMEECRRAASAPDWKWYCAAMGGVICPRCDRPVHLLKETKTAGGRYGEDIIKMLGVIGARDQIETRLEGWEITKHGLADRQGLSSAAREGGAVAVDLGQGEAAPPRSSDNNCTEDQERIRLKELLSEMSRLRLDDWQQDRVLQGAVVKFNGLFISVDQQTRELNVSQSHPLSDELNRMGLDGWTQDRVIQGAVVKFDGLFVWIGHQTRELNVRRSHPNAQDLDMNWLEREASNRISDRVDQLRAEAINLVTRGGDIEQWLEHLPHDYHQLAIEQVEAAIHALEHADDQI